MAKSPLNGWTKALVTIAGIIFAAGILYACVSNNTSKICSNEIAIKEVDDKVDTTCNEVVGLQKDVFYIREKVDTNARVQQQILQEIKDIKK